METGLQIIHSAIESRQLLLTHCMPLKEFFLIKADTHTPQGALKTHKEPSPNTHTHTNTNTHSQEILQWFLGVSFYNMSQRGCHSDAVAGSTA